MAKPDPDDKVVVVLAFGVCLGVADLAPAGTETLVEDSDETSTVGYAGHPLVRESHPGERGPGSQRQGLKVGRMADAA